MLTFVSHSPEQTVWNKLEMLRVAHRVFDPLGFVVPYIVVARKLLQECWKAGKSWTQPLDPDVEKRWLKWLDHLPALSSVTVPRVLYSGHLSDHDKRELHVFCDASEQGYAAVAYSRLTKKDGTVEVVFVRARAKIVPMNAKRSIPKLELMGVDLGRAMALHSLQGVLVDKADVTFWTDLKTCVLWSRMDTGALMPFVHNRVEKLKEDFSPRQLRWVPTDQNPADIPSRGCLAGDLLKEELWWQGPTFLRRPQSDWPSSTDTSSVDAKADAVEEVKKARRFDYEKLFCSANKLDIEDDSRALKDSAPRPDPVHRDMLDPKYHSSYGKLLHFAAVFLRRIGTISPLRPVSPTTGVTTRSKADRRSHLYADRKGRVENYPAFSVADLDAARIQLCRLSQAASLTKTIRQLSSNAKVPNNNPLRKLDPTMDEEGVVRLSGRLKQANNLTFDMQHPILLHANDSFTHLLVRHTHERELSHSGGRSDLRANLNRRYWIHGGANLIRKVLSSCVMCKRRKPTKMTQQMAPLPSKRIVGNTDRVLPFQNISLDAAGPWMVKQEGRGAVRKKRWLLVIRCLTFGAVYMDVLAGMSWPQFLMTFDRFCSIRGRPMFIYCGNGSNFVGCARALEGASHRTKP